MTPRWTFGEAPMPQTVEVAALLRRVTGLTLAAEHHEPAVDELIADLRRAEQALLALVPTDHSPRIGAAVDGDGRLYLDHARDVGAFDPAFPEYEITVDGDRATGSVEFPIVFEGPPGYVHGGFLGVFFDCVVQHHNCEVRVAGKTTSLALRYRRPTPLLTTLDFTVERTHADGRITSIARLLSGDELLCEAEVRAVAGDLAALPPSASRRPS